MQSSEHPSECPQPTVQTTAPRGTAGQESDVLQENLAGVVGSVETPAGPHSRLGGDTSAAPELSPSRGDGPARPGKSQVS